MKKILLLLRLFCTIPIIASAQSFQAKEVFLYDYQNAHFEQKIPVEVSGLVSETSDSFGLESVILNISHERTSDLKVQLQSPDGTTIWLTNRNGGIEGKNYINTTFSQFGENGLINNGTSPFTGNYIPDGSIHYFTNGKDPNGTWYLKVEDLKKGVKGYLNSIELIFGNNPAVVKYNEFCNFKNPNRCGCAEETQKTCELLPDLVIVPYFSIHQNKEFAQNDPNYPGHFKLAVAIANIGTGPMEVAPSLEDIEACKKDPNCVNDLERRFNLQQKIYTLDEDTFSSRTVSSGTVYYDSKPGHDHYHVDDWVHMRIVKVENGERRVISNSSKVSFCLFTNGMLNGKDSSGIIDGKQYGSDMLNYALGDYLSCNLSKQGISVGGYDYYGMMYEGQYIILPKGMKNGRYILEIEIDPKHKYHESNRSNNLFKMPIEIKLQE